MINTIKGDILTATGIIVHGCNAQGVMGSGVALQIKKKWPECYQHYVYHLRHHKKFTKEVWMGSVATWRSNASLVICNAITQEFYGRDKDKVYVDYPSVKKAFEHVNRITRATNIKEVNFPLIGCGLGGGDWGVVSKIIDETLSDDLQKNLWVLE